MGRARTLESISEVGRRGLPAPRPPSLVPLSRQLIFPDLVEGLVLMNIDPNGKGWIDWAATKVSEGSPAGVGVQGGPHTGLASARSSPA